MPKSAWTPPHPLPSLIMRIWCLTSFSTLFKSYWDNGRMINALYNEAPYSLELNSNLNQTPCDPKSEVLTIWSPTCFCACQYNYQYQMNLPQRLYWKVPQWNVVHEIVNFSRLLRIVFELYFISSWVKVMNFMTWTVLEMCS